MDVNELMKMAQSMQSKLQEAQSNSGDLRVTGESGGGMVKVVVNGRMESQSVSIDPKIVDLEDLSLLEDLIRAAINDAVTKTSEKMQGNMGDVAQNMGIDLNSILGGLK